MSDDIRLSTKVQHKHFETGEYTSIAIRTCEETIALIEEFPWLEERYTPVELTGPSIVIEDDKGRYLKFAHYYDPEFCFYFIDENGKFYRKVIETIKDGHAIIKSFYNGKLQMDGFVRDKLRFNYLKHFRTKNFVYKVTFGYSLLYLALANFTTVLCVIVLYSSLNSERPTPPSVIFSGLLYWFILSGVNYIYFINYYLYSRKLFIRVSQGMDEFEYGNRDNYTVYNKRDIACIRYHQIDNHRNPFATNKVIEVVFKDGREIKFPNLLVSSSTFHNKCRDTHHKDIKRFLPYFIRT